jgi:hypothetical protein
MATIDDGMLIRVNGQKESPFFSGEFPAFLAPSKKLV